MAYGQPTNPRGVGFNGYNLNSYPSYNNNVPSYNNTPVYNNNTITDNQGGQMGTNVIPGQQTFQMQQPVQNMVPVISSASRPVTSIEEARSVAADFQGNLMLFPDIMHGRIYLKRWNFNTGQAEFYEYAPVQPVQPTQDVQQQDNDTIPEQPSYATVESVNGIQEYVKTLERNIDNLSKEINRLKKPSNPNTSKQYQKKKVENVRLENYD